LTVHVAFCLVLLVSAILFSETIAKSLGRDYGFDTEHALAVSVQPSIRQFASTDAGPSASDRATTVAQYVAALRATEGVEAVAFGSLPLSGRNQVLGASAGEAAERYRRWVVGPGYARAAGLSLVAGHDLQASDALGSTVGVLVSEAFAGSRWPQSPSVGKEFDVTVVRLVQRRPAQVDERRRVVGVVRDAVRQGIRADTQATIFEAAREEDLALSGLSITVVIRATRLTGALKQVVTRTTARYFPFATQANSATARDIVQDDTRAEALGALLFSTLSVAAVLLAVTGIAGFAAALVAARRREIGLRLALGAQGSDVVALIRRSALYPVLTGAGLGLIVWMWVSRLVASYMVEVSTVDIRVLATTVAILLTVGWLSSYLPARRALHVTPAEVLREE
jgi:hypothetical protein